jgi:hypothetical protein
LSAELDAAKVAGIQTKKLVIKRALKQQEEAMEQEIISQCGGHLARIGILMLSAVVPEGRNT